MRPVPWSEPSALFLKQTSEINGRTRPNPDCSPIANPNEFCRFRTGDRLSRSFGEQRERPPHRTPRHDCESIPVSALHSRVVKQPSEAKAMTQMFRNNVSGARLIHVLWS